MSDYAVSRQAVDSYIEKDQPESITDSYKPQLGEWCEIRAIAKKTRAYAGYNRRSVRWLVEDCTPPIKAMYIGFRVVWDGTTYIDGDGYVDSFKRERSLYVWVFVDNERRNPFYVFPRDVYKIRSPK